METTNKVAIVTGATSGIGRYTAQLLPKEGFGMIFVVGRNEEKGAQVVKEIQKAGGEGFFCKHDFSLLSEVKKFVEFFKTKSNRLDLLIHSAGIIKDVKCITTEGFETNFVTNFLSRFLLTNLLLDILKKSAPSRILLVAGPGEWVGPPDLTNLNAEKFFSYPPWSFIYGNPFNMVNFQTSNDVYTIEMAKRLEGTKVTINCMDPGMVDTEIRRELGWIDPVMRCLGRTVLRSKWMTCDQGAVAPLYLATSSTLEGVSGKLFNLKKELPIPTWATANDIGEKLWEKSWDCTKPFFT